MSLTTARKSAARKSGPAGLRDAREALYRQHITAAAEAVFAEQGFANARMQAIARAAGVSLTTLYQSFPGKDDLYRAVLVARDEQMLDEVARRVQAADAPAVSVAWMLQLLGAQVGFLLRHPDYLKMQLADGRAWYHSAARPSAAEQGLWEQGSKLLAEVFDAVGRAGLLVPGPAEAQARLMLSLQQARLAGWVADGMQETHAEVIARIQADFVRQFCRPAVAARMLTEDGARLRDASESGLS